MTEPDHAIAVQRAAPYRTVFRPAIRVAKQALDEALCDPPVMRKHWQVDVDQCVGSGEPLPRRYDTAKAVDDPLIPPEDVGVHSQKLLMWELAAVPVGRPIAFGEL